MKRPSRLLSVAVVVSALSPAALLAYQIWRGETWSGFLRRDVVSSMIIKDAPPLVIPIWHASLAFADPQYYSVELFDSASL